MIFDDKKNSIKRNVDRNTMETYNYNDNNSNNNSEHLKLIGFFINIILGYFEQFIKSVMIIQSIFNNAEISDILRY